MCSRTVSRSPYPLANSPAHRLISISIAPFNQALHDPCRRPNNLSTSFEKPSESQADRLVHLCSLTATPLQFSPHVCLIRYRVSKKIAYYRCTTRRRASLFENRTMYNPRSVYCSPSSTSALRSSSARPPSARQSARDMQALRPSPPRQAESGTTVGGSPTCPCQAAPTRTTTLCRASRTSSRRRPLCFQPQ